jgi:hypothetical protein
MLRNADPALSQVLPDGESLGLVPRESFRKSGDPEDQPSTRGQFVAEQHVVCCRADCSVLI